MIQNQEKKYFLSQDSRLDSDSAPFAVSPNSWVNAENIRVRTTDAGVTETVESIGGTVLLSTPQPSITFLTIGAAEEVARSRFCEFKYCTTGPWHKIICWDEDLQQELDVLLSSQVDGGLNFDKNSLINNAYIVDGLLFWTDNLNEPKKINIDAGIKLNNPSYVTNQQPYATPIFYTTATLIKRPPIYPLSVVKYDDTGYDNNFIYNIAVQATYRYYYRDYEISALASYGQLAPFNFTSETYNSINLTLPFSEYIDDDIQKVEICIKFGNTGSTFAIKTWDKNSAADLAEIEAHNAGTTALTYRFYNDVTGNPLNSVEANAPFHGVPLLSKSLAFSKNRLLLGNNLFGYDTPTKTSLALSLGTYDTGNAGTYTGAWKYVVIQFQQYSSPYSITSVTFYYAYNATIGAYYFIAYTSNATPPASFNTVDATTAWATENDLAAFFARNYAPSGTHALYTGWTFIDTGNTTDLIVTVASNGLQFFKSASTYNVSIAFYDRFRRKCGVVDVSNKITIPERTYDQTVFSTTIQWALSNTDAIDEIPDWAYYYQIVITKSLTTRFFVEGMTMGAAYATKTTTPGVYTYGTTYNKDTCYALALNISTLDSEGLGYVYEAGDLARIHVSTVTNYNSRVIGQDGVYVLLAPLDLGTLSLTTSKFIFELYTPYVQTVIEPYYETGNVYSIISPATSGRFYSVLIGSINGDSYAIERTLADATKFFVEAMSPNDLTWQDWEQDRGWVNYVDKLGQSRHVTNITWSDVIISGTKTNGLNVFQPLSRKDLPIECGQIQKLQLTSKVQNEKGVILLGLCQVETASMYMGESQVLSPQGDAFLATTTDVIGTINILKGNYGTVNPESVIEFRGNVFWLDANNGKFIQYGANGLFPISNYKMTRFWKLFCNLYLSMTTTEIEALGSRPFVFTTVDPHHSELLISIPKLSNMPPKGYLPDYSSIIYPFDIWDAQGKTIVYKLDTGVGNNPIWMGAYSFNPEYFITLQNKLFSNINGHLYLHNQVGNPCEFYGVQYSSKIMIIGNALPNKPKQYDNNSVESNMVPSFVYLYNNYPVEQASNLVDEDFRDQEGIFYSTIKRNNLRITENGYVFDGLLTGEKMRNVAMWFMYEWRISGIPLELKFINIGFSISRGNPV